jgi:hypothetical protein
MPEYVQIQNPLSAISCVEIQNFSDFKNVIRCTNAVYYATSPVESEEALHDQTHYYFFR